MSGWGEGGGNACWAHPPPFFFNPRPLRPPRPSRVWGRGERVSFTHTHTHKHTRAGDTHWRPHAHTHTHALDSICLWTLQNSCGLEAVAKKIHRHLSCCPVDCPFHLFTMQLAQEPACSLVREGELCLLRSVLTSSILVSVGPCCRLGSWSRKWNGLSSPLRVWGGVGFNVCRAHSLPCRLFWKHPRPSSSMLVSVDSCCRLGSWSREWNGLSSHVRVGGGGWECVLGTPPVPFLF